jgi:salicylate hydroxylase
MHAVIVGGGIGGLACAQGLERRGFQATVIERDTDLRATGGYKLHLGVPAVQALRELLPPANVEALLGTSVATRDFALVLRDHRGRHLLRSAEATGGLALDVDRITLREVLAIGLERRLMLGRRCVGWRVGSTSVRAVLDDGSAIEADLLVIADGATSALAEKLAGAPTSVPCGLVGVAGRSPWADLSPRSRALLSGEPMLAIGPGGTGLFATQHDPVGRSALRTRLACPATTDPVVIWGLLALDSALPPSPSSIPARRLQALSAGLLRAHRWAEPLVALIDRADPGSVAAFRLNAADAGRIAPWSASRVTALGDAVHAMPPTGGQGAATAVLDAFDLVEAMQAVRCGEKTLVVAVHDYEARLRERGARAVRESLEPVGWIRGAASPVGAAVLRAATPLIAAGGSLTRKALRRPPRP